jgi:uncharacterized transporter YbjL
VLQLVGDQASIEKAAVFLGNSLKELNETHFIPLFLPFCLCWLSAYLPLLNLNFVALSGLLAGSMTDPPALAFASNISHSDAPMVSYATVYPLTMLLRILSAQTLVLLLCG